MPDLLPSAIVLGGGANALSIARSLGRRGVKVFAINHANALVRHSRLCEWIPIETNGDAEAAWANFLVGPESDHLGGAVLLTGSDAGIQLVARHRELLQQKFLLDLSNPDAQLRMLDKLATYQAAREAGVPTPRFWLAKTRSQVLALRNELVFPLIVKPLLSHVFDNRFGKKFFLTYNFGELLDAFAKVSAAGIESMLVELIPGLDDRLSSYYTYLDEHGQSLFDFTKRVIRRFPANMGAGCYHIADHVPEVKELGLRLFRHVGLRGLANVEFKRDERDGQLKLIECNARFTAANGLVADSGLDLAWFVYCRLTGQPLPSLADYRDGVRMWYPVEDFKAFLELRRRGQLTFPQWLGSILHRQTFPHFRWSDPLPSVVDGLRRIGRWLGRSFARARAFVVGRFSGVSDGPGGAESPRSKPADPVSERATQNAIAPARKRWHRSWFLDLPIRLMYYSGLLHLVGLARKRFGRKRLIVLMYHRLAAERTSQPADEPAYSDAAPVENFDGHMRLLRWFGEPTALDDGYERLIDPASKPRALIAVTFDDGYRDNHTLGLPIWSKHRVPVTIFPALAAIDRREPLCWDELLRIVRQTKVANGDLRPLIEVVHELVAGPLGMEHVPEFTDRVQLAEYLRERLVLLPMEMRGIVLDELAQRLGVVHAAAADSPDDLESAGDEVPADGCRQPAADRLYMSWDELRMQSRQGVLVGGHTIRHPRLTVEASAVAEREIADCRVQLEAQLGRPVRCFAYPGGFHGPRELELVARAGYRVAVTVEKGVNYPDTHPHKLCRIGLSWDKPHHLAFKLAFADWLFPQRQDSAISGIAGT